MVQYGNTFGDKFFNFFLYFFLILSAITFLYPVWQTFVVSFASPEFAQSLQLKFWPDSWSLSSYKVIFSSGLVFIGYKNTLFRAFFGTLLNVTVTFMGGYVLTKKEMPFHSGILVYIMIPMFFGGGLIPSYMLIRDLHLMNNLWLFVLTGATSTWNLLLCRNFINTLPKSLEESAMIDGAHPLAILWRIIFPLSLPIVAVLALYSLVGQWNAWFDAYIYCNSRAKLVLSLVVRRIVIDEDQNLVPNGNDLLIISANHSPETVKSAMIMISVAPILMVYPFVQKYFVKGILVGSVKG